MKKTHVALFIWFFTASFGGHKIYLEDKLHYLLWYWLLASLTLGIVPLLAVLTIPSRVRTRNEEIKRRW